MLQHLILSLPEVINMHLLPTIPICYPTTRKEMRQDLSVESDHLLILAVLQAMDKETVSHKLKNLYKYWEIINICAYRSDVGLHNLCYSLHPFSCNVFQSRKLLINLGSEI